MASSITGALFLQDMALVLMVAAATTVLFHRLHQPVVLGYILAGVIVGTHGPFPGLVNDENTIEVLGELGVLFLLFALGLEFNVRKLRRVGVTAVTAGVLETSLMIWLGYSLGRFFGWSPLESIFLGAIISISSTTIIVKVLTELNQKDESWARIIFGVLIVEDIIAVLIITLLSTAASTGTLAPAEVGSVLLKLGVFMGSALVLGLVIVPRLVTWVSKFPVEEVLVIVTLGLAFGLSFLATELGLSSALGAFIMGALVSESTAVHRVEQKIVPIRDLFTAIFFVAVGMLLDPVALVANLPLVLAVTVAVIVGKVFAATFATFVSGNEPQQALRVGFGLAQIGEFSFIIAGLAVATGTTDAPLFAIAVAVSAITAFTTPLLYKAAPRAVHALERVAPQPVRTYASLYGAWVRQLRERGDGDPARGEARTRGAFAVLYGAAIVALLVAGAVLVQPIGDTVSRLVPVVPEGAVLVAGWTAVGLAALPFVLLFGRSLNAFVQALADAALPPRVRESAAGASIAVILRRTFLLASIVVFAAVFLVAATPFLPSALLVIAVLAGVTITSAFLYRSLVRFHERVDRTLVSVLIADDAPGAREEREEMLHLIREQYPWAVSARAIPVKEGVFAAHRTLRDLHLRRATGATVVGIQRGGKHLVNPTPDTVVLPGDRLVTLGEEDQVDAATAIVTAEARERQTTMRRAKWREILVAAGSALDGVTLAESRLRERTGATVVGIIRGGERVPSPGPDTRMEPGDVLLVVGTVEETRGVEALATGNEGAAPPRE